MTNSMEEKKVPNVTFRTRSGHEWVDRSSDDVFGGKTVIVFSLPGAFTPTCSSSHAPRYDQLCGTFTELGVDEVVCLSVNDAFVMNEWKADLGIENLTFLPDGNGAFTEGMGMLVDKEDLGFGKRSWRYSMLVRDGVVEKVFAEPQEPGDPYGVSDADTMLAYLAPDAATPLDVTVLSRGGCPHCARAKGLLRDANIPFEALELNKQFTDRSLRAVADATSLPQVFINGEKIGGADELETWLSVRETNARKNAA